jgi:hypothetical protein
MPPTPSPVDPLENTIARKVILRIVVPAALCAGLSLLARRQMA